MAPLQGPTITQRPFEALGLLHDASVDPLTGSAHLRVPVRTTPGRHEFGPSLALTYSSGAGNSPFGLGWSLQGASWIGIDMRERLPTYGGDDRFCHSNGDELVPALDTVDGKPNPRLTERDGHLVTPYLARHEGRFSRVEQWRRLGDGDIHWRVFSRDGVVSVYGRDPAARIADPAEPVRIFQWLLQAQYDKRGNAIEYRYVAETFDDVSAATPSEQTRLAEGLRPAQRYLKSIRYANTKPLHADDAAPQDSLWPLEVVFDYGDHVDGLETNPPSAVPDRVWPVRADPYSTHKAGFDLRTYRLCRRILMVHGFDALGSEPRVVGVTHLHHEELSAGSVLNVIGYTGHRYDQDPPASKSAVALRMTYSSAEPGSAFSAPPDETVANLPTGLAGASYRFVDLQGDGLPGVLAEGPSGWHYKRNLGGGRFGPSTIVAAKPSRAMAAVAVSDFDGDGNPDLVTLTGPQAGFYEYDREAEAWSGFQSFAEAPQVDDHAQTKLIDLDGDGLADLVTLREDRVFWNPAKGRDGFGAAREVVRPRGERAAPNQISGADLDVFFADMSGDGLLDIVEVGNGSVTYWPNLGGGRFGESIAMADAPIFDHDDAFDGGRLRFADLDGSGTSDLIYLGRGAITFWTNASGNGFAEGMRLEGMPHIADSARVEVLDFLADGTQCLVWSSPLPDDADAPLKFLPLTTGRPPRLLESVDGGMGKEIRFVYGNSAAHYLRDQETGRPWVTKLPTHLTTVDEHHVIDRIGGGRQIIRFAYRDGFFDGQERRFRGFGQIDRFDSNQFKPAGADDAESFAPPSCERMWFFVGKVGLGARRASTYYAGDARAARLPEPGHETLSDLSPTEFEDGFRAAAGQLLRQETYEVTQDGELAHHPFLTTEYGVRVRRIQAEQPGHHAVFMAYRSETLTHHYEEQPDDPNVSHHAVLAVDEGGETTRHVTIAYPRRPGGPDILPEQRQTLANLGTLRFVNLDTPDGREFGLPIETQDFELVALPPPEAAVYRLSELEAIVGDAVASPLAFHQAARSGSKPQGRLIGWTRSYYWNSGQTEPAPFGTASLPALPHHEEEACFTPELASDIYGDRVSPEMLKNDGRYRLADGHWWQSDSVTHYLSADEFLCVDKLVRSDGATTSCAYDRPYLLRTVSVTDPVGNQNRATLDYHTLDPVTVVDENDNAAEALVDALGMTVALTRSGSVLNKDGDKAAYGSDPIADYRLVAEPSVDQALDTPDTYLQTASKVFVYEADRWREAGLPPRTLALEREALVHDGEGGGDTLGGIRTSVTYFDGCSRPLQVKQRTDAGPAIQRDARGRIILNDAGEPAQAHSEERYAATGRVIYDHKQMPVREHQPYFTPSAEFEPDDVLRNLGTSTVTRYDAIGRVTRIDYPDGTFTKVEPTPWLRREYDQNDTVDQSTYKVLREPLSDENPEKRALQKALAHADTPKLVHLNGRGEEIRIVEQGGETPDRVTSYRLDAKGQQIELIDPRGLKAFTYRYDMVGRSLSQLSIDAGQSTNLPDADDRTLLIWNGRGHRLTADYDALDRPVTLSVREPDGAERVVERLVYGDTGGLTDATQKNANGQMVARFDPAGVVEVGAFAPDGTPLRYTRRLCADHRTRPDWANPDAVDLADQAFETSLALDALERPVERTGPDGVARRFGYAASGALSTIKIKTADGVFDDIALLEAIDVNERGQRRFSRLGNGVELNFEFDPLTFRVSRASARRAGAGARAPFHDMRYTYDPVGHMVRAEDRAQASGSDGSPIRGLAVPAVSDYTYDALYQLTRASGRVHRGLVAGDATNRAAFMFSRRAGLNDGAAIERYARSYSYDASGNLGCMRHSGASASWTDEFWISETSNRALPALDPNGAPVSNPEDRFDADGNATALSHIARLDWDYSAQIERAVIIDRSEDGRPDDAETYIYGADRDRVRRITERLLGSGETEIVDKIYLDDVEITRIYQAGDLILERITSQFDDSGQRIATLDQWTRDDRGRETDDISAKSLRYTIANAGGSAVLELNAAGEIIGYEEFFPYGGTAFIAGDNVRALKRKEHRHAGKERDAATGLYYYGQRYLTPWTGRWLSPDPAGPVDGSNLYQFVRSNPINRTDPDGLDSGSGDAGYDTYRIANLPESFRPAWNKLTQSQRKLVQSGKMHLLKDGRIVTPAEAKRLAAESFKKHGKRGRIYFRINRQQAVAATRKQVADMMSGMDLGNFGGFDASEIDPNDYNAPGAGDFGDGPAGEGDVADSPSTGADGGDSLAEDAQSDAVSGDGTQRAGGTDGDSAKDADGTTGSGSTIDGTGGAGMQGTGPGAGLAGSGRGGGGTDPTPAVGGLGSTGIGSGVGRGRGPGQGNLTALDPAASGTLGSGGGGGGGQATDVRLGADGDPAGVDWGVAGAAGDPQQDPPETPPPPSERPPEQGGTSYLPSSEGTEPAPSDLARNGDDPKGTLSGSLDGTSGARGDQANENQARGTDGSSGSDTGDVKGNAAGREGGTVVGNGQNGEEPNTLDRITRIAGYANLEFEDKPGGESGGAPGGKGSTNLGWVGSVLYIGLSIVALLGLGKLIQIFKVPLKAAIKSIGSKLLSAAKAPARLLASMWRNAGYRRTLYRMFRERHLQLAKTWWQRHSIEIGVTKGAIPYAGHWGWRTGGQAFEAAGSKPIGYIFDAFYRSSAKFAFREGGWKAFYKEVFKRQFVGTRSARKIFKNGFGFRVPALNPGRAASFASKDFKVFSCWTSTWNAFSRANYHLPSGLVGAGLYKGYSWLFGGSEDGASGGGKQDRGD